MILELNGTKVTIVDKTLGYQGDNLVNTIQVTVDKDSTWSYKLDMYKGKSKCFDSVLMTREGNICTVQLTNEILSYGGRYVFQLRGYTDTQTYHSDIFESWVNASIEYQDDCKQTDCGCDCKLPTEFYQVEDNVTEINNHPPYPGDNNKWMIWDVNKHEYVESDIDVISGGEEYQTKANLTTSVTAQSTDEQYPSAKAVYDAISNASIVTVEITGAGTDSDPYVSSMTFDEIQSAMQAGRTVVGIRPSSNPAFFIACISFSGLITFTRLAVLNIMNDDVICESFTIFKDGHITHKNSRLEETANKVTSLSADSTNVQYPSAKAVYDAITAAKPEIVIPSAESTDTQAASAKAVWDMLGGGGGSTDISLGVTGAAVGDIIKVKSVDANGKPTAWEAVTAKLANPNALTFTGAVTGSYDGSEPLSVEIPSGGGGSGASESWKLIRTINIVSGTSSYSFDSDNNGNAFKIKNFLILIDAYPAASGHLEIKPNGNFLFHQTPTGKPNYPFSFMMKRVTDGRYILENSTTNNLIFERKLSKVYSSFGEFTSFAFWFSATPASDTTMYILGEDV